MASGWSPLLEKTRKKAEDMHWTCELARATIMQRASAYYSAKFTCPKFKDHLQSTAICQSRRGHRCAGEKQNIFLTVRRDSGQWKQAPCQGYMDLGTS